VDGGMDRYATELVKTLPEGCLLLNHRVKRWKKKTEGDIAWALSSAMRLYPMEYGVRRLYLRHPSPRSQGGQVSSSVVQYTRAPSRTRLSEWNKPG
jgi:hypothetical protein